MANASEDWQIVALAAHRRVAGWNSVMTAIVDEVAVPTQEGGWVSGRADLMIITGRHQDEARPKRRLLRTAARCSWRQQLMYRIGVWAPFGNRRPTDIPTYRR